MTMFWDDVRRRLSLALTNDEAGHQVAGILNQPTERSTIELSAGGGVTQTATITLRDATGDVIKAVQVLDVYMCTDDAGATPSEVGAEEGVTIDPGAAVVVHTTDLAWKIAFPATGIVVLEFDHTLGAEPYEDRIALVLPNGKMVVSEALNVEDPGEE
jgi:hypothetical protein